MLRHLAHRFYPQTLTVFHEGYSWKLFAGDLLAGVVVGIIALPLSIAFGVASGVTPAHGIYTAIVAGFLISLFGGSRVQIGGPTGAFIVIVYGIVQQLGIEGLVLATILSGIFLIVMGLTGLGSLIKYIPYPVTLGFTAGIAVVIATSQVPSFFGLTIDEAIPTDFVSKIFVYVNHVHSVNLWSVVLALVTVAIIVVTPYFTRRVPGAVFAVAITAVVAAFLALPVDTIGQKLGQPPTPLELGFPRFVLPTIDTTTLLAKFPDIVRAALAITMLGAIESLLSAVVADGMTGTKHRSNTELVAQGIANVVVPFYGGIPATGAIARTAANVRNGGKTPVAGMIHAVTLLAIVLCFGGYAARIPYATLAGVLVMVAVHMSDARLFVKMVCRAPRSDVAVMLITFFLTVFLDLTVAIPVGLVLASFLFMRRMETAFDASTVHHHLHDLLADVPLEDPIAMRLYDVPDGVHVYDVRGPFFFGAAGKFQKAIEGEHCRVVILRLRNVPIMDATAIHAIDDLFHALIADKATLLMVGVRTQPMTVLERFGLADQIGRDNFFPTTDIAIIRAAEIVEAEWHVQ
ncbi:MAG: SulP family inorganic anion transporter [Thermoguttaceae bacterium]